MIIQEALDLIKSHEGLRLEAYPDVAHGWSVATIGYGHTNAMKPPTVKKGDRITKAEAENILLSDLAKTWDLMKPYIKVDLNEYQRGALISFTFNLGIGNFSRSTLLKKLNKGDFAGAAEEFDKWVYAGGKVYPGLVRRRKEEKELFLKGGSSPVSAHPKSTLLDLIAALIRRILR